MSAEIIPIRRRIAARVRIYEDDLGESTIELACAGGMVRDGYTDPQFLGMLMNPANAVHAHIGDHRNPRYAALRCIEKHGRREMTMKLSGHALNDGQFPDRTMAMAGKLACTYTMQMDTLKRMRGKGRSTRQRITVRHKKHIHNHQHVHMHEATTGRHAPLASGQEPTGFGSRHARSNGSRHACGATSWWIDFGPHDPGW